MIGPKNAYENGVCSKRVSLALQMQIDKADLRALSMTVS